MCGTTLSDLGAWNGIICPWNELLYEFSAKDSGNQLINDDEDGQLIMQGSSELCIASGGWAFGRSSIFWDRIQRSPHFCVCFYT